MKVKVSARGIWIPKSMLKGAREVEVRQEGGRIIVEPAADEDPIFGLGTDPVECGVSDASLLSEAVLAEDWNREEEDAAWEHLQDR